MNTILPQETPSRLWRRIEDGERQDLPSLPSLPAFDDSENHTDETDSIDDMDISNPIHSTPAAYSSHTMSTIKQPLSAASTVRFANSIASRSVKSGMSSSRSSSTRLSTMPQEEMSFNISIIPSLPNPVDDIEIRSSDQDGSSMDSMDEPHLPPMDPDAGDEDLDLSDALQSVSRSSSPLPDAAPTPSKKYDYSVSLITEPKPSPFDKLRNVSIRRPLSRNARTPSLTRTNTPSPSSSISHSTPHSTYSFQNAAPSPLPALSIPLPRSVTASPVPLSRAASASPMPARLVPLPASAHNSPLTAYSPQPRSAFMEQSTYISADDLPEPSSMAPPDLSLGSDAQSEQGGRGSEHTTEEREPTFSSEEGATPSARNGDGEASLNLRQAVSPAPLSTAFSSPAPSAVMTPTPAFQPRLRARFNVPTRQPQASTTPTEPLNETAEEQSEETQEYRDESTWHVDQQQQQQHLEDPATPNANAHKRSFLLSVINSTARPRLKHHTPHPNRAEPAPATPGTTLRGACAGLTPGQHVTMRRRLSHPLAQGWTAAAQSDSGSESPRLSGDDAGADRASFISTASSQDLVMHVRANASFDPVIGLGDRGHGVGRFNAGKLNTYLHGLNRKLQEENETLVAQLRAYEERLGSLEESGTNEESEVQHNQAYNRRASGGRRVSMGPLGLNDVLEEGSVEERAAMADMLEEMREELDKVAAEKDDVEKALEHEREERAKDKEKWRDRMSDVEKGVEDIVDDLYRKLRDAEDRAQAAEKEKQQTVRETERRLAEVVVERDVLQERIEKAEGALQDGSDLGGEVNAANERVSKVLSDLKNANIQIKELEEEVAHADERLDALEHELREEKKLVSELEEELQLKSEELSDTLGRIGTLEGDLKATQDELEQERAGAAELEDAANAAADRIEALEEEFVATQNKLESVSAMLEQEREKASRLEAESTRAAELAKQMEEALDAAEENVAANEHDIASLRVKVAALERELDKSRSHFASTQPDPEVQADIEALEAELDDAHKEIARLNVIVSQSPARKAMDKAKDTKIEMLEQERDDLLERLKNLKNNTLNGTPGKLGNGSGISPMHRHILQMSFKSPKTPGAPLRDMSWLQSTMHDATAMPLVVEIERLQNELEKANESIDEKLDRLEDAGHGMVSLTNKLEDARAKIVVLEDEIGRLNRREDRRTQRLEKLRCQKCRVKVDVRALQHRTPGDDSSFVDPADLSVAQTEPPTPPTKTSERLRMELQSVNSQLASMKQQWESEKRKLLGENASLKDATSRLNAEVRQAKDEAKRANDNERGKSSMQSELDRAKRMVEDLEIQLKTERSRLRTLITDQMQAERQKEEVVLQLRRTESDMTDVREELQRIKHENHELEAELRANSTVEQKARLLESKVAENADTIEQLRRERSLLVADHKNLQKKYAQVSENVSKIREQHATSQTSHDHRRHDLDLRLLEIEDLRRALSSQADELQRVEEEKSRAAHEKSDMAKTVASLEADLRRVKRDAEAFGKDLKHLRAQKERLEAERKEEVAKTERAQKQSQTQIRLLKEEAKEQREKNKALQEQWTNHDCAVESNQLEALKARHKSECKGLVVQIKYLKAKWVRESTLRSDLGYQKQYLLVLLTRCERKEEKILAAIAKIGFPSGTPPLPAPARKKRSFRNVALSVIFMLRAQRASIAWREQRSSKDAIAAALQDVRRNRQDPKGKGIQPAVAILS